MDLATVRLEGSTGFHIEVKFGWGHDYVTHFNQMRRTKWHGLEGAFGNRRR